ncbi:MAG: methyltransferase domain-containing protein [Candidatus Delongbacteria bacterium]|nr:methyltransferase domain-containing protein [Candidatus Delongbacteria bacterium]MBN2833489.1 methyltransferase domain-containing protein [Candidatus Delongbacteria bacterium]
MKTNYLLHDSIYKKKYENGDFSWGGKDTFENNVSHIDKLLKYSSSAKKILEVGCGNGVLSFYLEKKGFNVVGIDISPEAIKWAKKIKYENNYNSSFYIANILDDELFGDEKYDLIIDSYCYHCIIGDDRDKFISNIKKLLKQNGFFIIQTMCNEPAEDILPYYDKKSRCMIKNGIAGRYFGKEDSIITELTEFGFEPVHYYVEHIDQDTLYGLFRKKY